MDSHLSETRKTIESSFTDIQLFEQLNLITVAANKDFTRTEVGL